MADSCWWQRLLEAVRYKLDSLSSENCCSMLRKHTRCAVELVRSTNEEMEGTRVFGCDRRRISGACPGDQYAILAQLIAQVAVHSETTCGSRSTTGNGKEH